MYEEFNTRDEVLDSLVNNFGKDIIHYSIDINQEQKVAAIKFTGYCSPSILCEINNNILGEHPLFDEAWEIKVNSLSTSSDYFKPFDR